MSRPRNVDFNERILTVAAELLAEQGHHGLSMSEVARRAGVGKPALYRRFASKAELVMAITVDSGAPPSAEFTGSFAVDIDAALRLLADSLREAPREVLGAQIGLAIADSDASSRLVRTVIAPAHTRMLTLWNAAVAQGQVRPDLDGSAALTAVSASVIHTILVLHEDASGPWLDQLIVTFVRGVRCDPG